MSQNIDDISSIFRVSDHPDMIFANESRFLEKSKKIAQYHRYIGNLPIYPTQKCRLVKKFKKKKNRPIYRRYSLLNNFFVFFLSNGQKLLTCGRLRFCLINSNFSTASS